jgi:ABC-type multidrug transport system ATPase subunit
MLGAAKETAAPPAGPAVTPAAEPAAGSMADVGDVEAGGDARAQGFLRLRSRSGESNLSWRGLSLRIGVKQVLEDVSGHVDAGQMCAIMGPSGSGKTSVLNVLAGRVLAGRGRKVSGLVTVNGRAIVPQAFRSRIAFVLQHDSLYATATCREALELSAHLRLPRSVSAARRAELVEALIESLGLSHVQDTMIGSELVRGLSGGEKKRVSIGVELVTQPSILFADEPLSGLDTFSARKVTRILKDLAQAGRCAVLVTVHQPSSEIFQLFDSALVLKQGRVLYHDAVAAMPQALAAMGLPVPALTNPADFVVIVAQTRGWDALVAHNPDAARAAAEPAPTPAPAAPSESEEQEELRRAARRERRKPGLGVQVSQLFLRELRNVARDRGALVANVAITALLNVLYAAIFTGVARVSNEPYSWPAAQGALTLVFSSAMFSSAQGPLLTFPLERAVSVREMQTGTYSPVAYFASKFTIELPSFLLNAATVLLVTYWWIGFFGNFFVLLFYVWLVMLAASAFSFVLGAAVTDAKQAQQFAPLVLVPQLLFSGLFLPISLIPPVLRWAQYLCALVYGVKLALVNEFNDNPACGPPCRQAVLVNNAANEDDVWLYILVLVAIAVGFRLLSLALLVLRARFFAN